MPDPLAQKSVPETQPLNELVTSEDTRVLSINRVRLERYLAERLDALPEVIAADVFDLYELSERFSLDRSEVRETIQEAVKDKFGVQPQRRPGSALSLFEKILGEITEPYQESFLFRDFVRSLYMHPQPEVSTEYLASIADKEFFKYFLSSTDPRVKAYRQELEQTEGGVDPEKLPWKLRREYRQALEEVSRFKKAQVEKLSPLFENIRTELNSAGINTLDDIEKRNPAVKRVMSELGIGVRPGELVKFLVYFGVIDPVRPDGLNLTRGGGHPSYYFDGNFVGEKSARQNLIKALREQIKTLDEVNNESATPAVKSLLNLPRRSPNWLVAHKLVKLGVLDGNLPDRYQASRYSPGFYFDERVVGKKLAGRNLRKYVREKFKTLDDITRSDLLAKALGVEASAGAISRECIRRGYLSPRIPAGHRTGKSGGWATAYFNSSYLLSERQKIRNLHQSLRDNFNTLEDFFNNKVAVQIFTRQLGLPNRATALAAYAVKHQLVSGDLDSQQKISLGKNLHPVFKPEIVGGKRAQTNRREFLRAVFSTLDDVTQDKLVRGMATLIGLKWPVGARAFAKELVRQGIIDGAIPYDHKNSRVKLSYYLDRNVVGNKLAADNARKYFNMHYNSIEEAVRDSDLASFLGVSSRATAEFRRRLEEFLRTS
ncbi:MAG: hypothetical protein D6719_04145 [Candidatus Dadabacteria bacterium]|nr:MAG: hypothetical protein D6719_04145 [Candidatus Dadabacteria bacterium]